jgi:hypothetical protein
MWSNRQALWRALAALVLTILMSGCASNHPASTSTHSVTIIDNIPPCPTPATLSPDSTAGPGSCPIILTDTSPGQLDLSLNLMIGGYEADTRDTVELNITFTHQGHTVQFVAGEHISCNGFPIQGYGANFNGKASTAVFAGQPVTCIYTSGDTSATFSFTAPLAPAILSPQEHARVTRSAHTPVRYRISQDQPFYVIALGPNTKAWTTTAANQPNPATLDTSAFQPGDGAIALNQLFTLTDLSAPDFQSAQGQGSAEYEMPVSWV